MIYDIFSNYEQNDESSGHFRCKMDGLTQLDRKSLNIAIAKKL